MLDALFTWLSRLMEAAPLWAICGAFLWGMMSVLLSPCHLTSIPLIVAYIGEQGKMSVKRAFYTALAFSVGILATIAIIGVVTSLMGRMLGDIGKTGNYIVAAIFFLVGIYLLEIFPISIPGLSGVKFKQRGLFPAFLLGLLFGIALGPCTFAYMAPIIAMTFSASSKGFLFGFGLMAAYGLGHCFVIVLAGTFTEWLQRYLNWNEKSKGTKILKRICGILIILGGIYFLTM